MTERDKLELKIRLGFFGGFLLLGLTFAVAAMAELESTGLSAFLAGFFIFSSFGAFGSDDSE